MELPKADEKILYKFVVNDQWIIDPDAPQEDDGHNNLNNVLHPEQIKPKASVVPEALTTSSAAPESTTAALAGGVPLEPKREATEGETFARYLKDDVNHSSMLVTPASDNHLHETTSNTPGAFPETPANETPANETPANEKETYGVSPLPPTEGAGNPVNVPAGDKVPPSGEVTSNTVHSSVTTSQEDYEKSGSSYPFIGGALAALGLGGAAAASKKENLIPESSLPMGENADKSLDAGPLTSSAGANATTSELAGKVPIEEKKAATEIDPSSQAPVSEVPETVKESIEAAHAEPEATASSEAVKEKSEVEQELLKKVPEQEESGEPAPTIAAATSATAPEPTTETTGSSAPGQSSVAAAAVSDGADGEATEAAKTTIVPEKTEGDNTEYAPPHAAGTAPGVSSSAAAAISDGAEDPTLLDEPAVQMGIKNDAEAAGGTTSTTEAAGAAPVATAPTTTAPESKKETTAATPTAPTTDTSTPKKTAATTPSSTPASSSSATKEKKKKHRVSSFFKKIFD